jgi:hypothetical protein
VLLAADAPGAAEAIAVVLDLIALQAFDGDHDQLIAGVGLQLLPAWRRGRLGGGLQQMGLIDDAAGQAREGRIGLGERRNGGRQPEGQQQPERGR